MRPAAPSDTTVVTVEFLPPLPLRQTAVAYAVTDDSVLLGVSYEPTNLFQRATRWFPGQAPADLGGPGDPASGPSTNARGGSGNGVIVGYANTDPYDWQPIRWSREGSIDTLASLSAPPFSGGFAYAVSNSRYVAGCSWVLTGDPLNLNAVLWSPDGGVQNLGTMGADWSCAYGLSLSGFVVGEAADHAFRWSPTDGMQDLGTLGGPTSRAFGVNALGEVVGEADQDPRGIPSAFLWTPERGMRQPPLVEPGTYSAAYAINDAGDAVGYAMVSPSEDEHAILWPASGGAVDLTVLSMPPDAQQMYGHALAISQHGLIAGFQYNPATARVEAALWCVTVVRR